MSWHRDNYRHSLAARGYNKICAQALHRFPERDSLGVSTGKCADISKYIASQTGGKVINVATPGSLESSGHVAVITPDDNIIDPEVWQYIPKYDAPLDRRMISFTKKDYEDMGFKLNSDQMKERDMEFSYPKDNLNEPGSYIVVEEENI